MDNTDNVEDVLNHQVRIALMGVAFQKRYHYNRKETDFVHL